MSNKTLIIIGVLAYNFFLKVCYIFVKEDNLYQLCGGLQVYVLRMSLLWAPSEII